MLFLASKSLSPFILYSTRVDMSATHSDIVLEVLNEHFRSFHIYAVQIVLQSEDIFVNIAGKSADIHYGSGAISGFFSQDNVKVGDLVVKKQVLGSAFYGLKYNVK